MKKVIGAFVLALISIATCVISLFYIENTSNKALFYISEIENQIEKNDYKKSKINAENLENFWSQQNNIFATFVHHEMLEEIDQSIRSINVMLKNFDENEKINLKVECEKAQNLLENFKNSEFPTISNVL